MKENKNAFLLTSVLAFSLFILFMVISVTEQKALNFEGAHKFMIAATLAAVVCFTSFTTWKTLYELEHRPLASYRKVESMKEYTVVYNVELTYIERADYAPTDASDPKETERMLKEATGADDVHVSKVKVFEREL